MSLTEEEIKNIKWEKEFNNYRFEIDWHYGKKQVCLEVMTMHPEPWVAKDYINYVGYSHKFFNTYDEAIAHLRYFGYGNSLRFIMED